MPRSVCSDFCEKKHSFTRRAVALLEKEKSYFWKIDLWWKIVDICGNLYFTERNYSRSDLLEGIFFFFLLTWEINRHFTAIEFTRVWTNITWQIFFSSLQRCDHLHHTYKFTFRITWIIVAEFSTKAQNC